MLGGLTAEAAVAVAAVGWLEREEAEVERARAPLPLEAEAAGELAGPGLAHAPLRCCFERAWAKSIARR